MNAYLISGLGADSRAFLHLELPPGYKKIPLDWIPPHQHESLSSYALRLAARIDQTKPFVLIGLSMGGMMATEISRSLHPERTILISSMPSYRFLPGYFRLAGRLKLHSVAPISVLKAGSYLKRFFTRESPADKKLIWQVIRESDPAFIRWGMAAVLGWKGESGSGDYIHIHGTGDWLLPVGKSKPTHLIKDGGHMMIFDRCGEINRILAEQLPATV